MNNTTTKTFPRTARLSGTQYAAAIERTRRHDASGRLIVVVMVVLASLACVLL